MAKCSQPRRLPLTDRSGAHLIYLRTLDDPLARIRVEHWGSAIHQGRHAARSMLGHDDPYARQPYFFTDQYDLGLEYVGHLGPDVYDEVVIRGDLRNRQFTALWIHNNHVIAGVHTNVWDAIDAWIGRVANPALRDPTVELTEIPASSQASSDLFRVRDGR